MCFHSVVVCKLSPPFLLLCSRLRSSNDRDKSEGYRGIFIAGLALTWLYCGIIVYITTTAGSGCILLKRVGSRNVVVVEVPEDWSPRVERRLNPYHMIARVPSGQRGTAR